MASKGLAFQKVIEKGTVFIDIGGGSVQISLFDKDSLVTTQNIRPGVLRMREELGRLSYRTYQLEELVDELIGDSIRSFRDNFAGNREIKNMILVDDYISLVLQKGIHESGKNGQIDARVFLDFVGDLKQKKAQEIASILGIPEENTSLVYLSALMLRNMIKTLGVEMIWAPGVCLCDGMAYEYAEKNRLLSVTHNFEQDILACAWDINKRYQCDEKKAQERAQIALNLFDHMKKAHGLSKRDRLLLQLAAILCETGNYISLTSVGESSYNIVMATEMIGLSHLEREIVANVVKYVKAPFEYFDTLGRTTTIDRSSYLKIAKLTAMLRLVKALDISHKQKFERVKVVWKDDIVTITVETNSDMTLELGFFEQKADFFEEVFNIKPVIRQKKSNI